MSSLIRNKSYYYLHLHLRHSHLCVRSLVIWREYTSSSFPSFIVIQQQYNIRNNIGDNIRDNITAVHKTPPSVVGTTDDITYFDVQMSTDLRCVVFIFMCIDINDFNFMHSLEKKC